MKWDIDRALEDVSPEHASGTTISQVFIELKTASEVEWARKIFVGVRWKPFQLEQGFAKIWCLGLGIAGVRKHFIYGQTIREAYLRARKLAKKNELGIVKEISTSPVGIDLAQVFVPKMATKKKKPKMKAKKKTVKG